MTKRILNTRVAGVTYEGRQQVIALLTGREACWIVPEPDNPRDPNALAVHVAVPGNGIQHIGYVPKEIAAEIAPVMEGEPLMCAIAKIIGGFETYDGGETSYGVRLRIELPMLEGPDHV